VLHVDLYRLDDAEEVEELGLEDERGDGLLLVEWPERAGARAWPDALALTLAIDPAGGRRLTAEVPKAWEQRWPI
jgi:tRNA threonylcarbamoyladenosine biosynthesis protein TsaE